MKRAATIGLALTLVTLSSSLFSTPAMAEGLLSDLVKDTLGTAAGIVGGVVNGAAGITAGAVSGAANIVSGTVDATGNVLDASGHVVGRVIVSPTTTAITPGWSVVTPGSTTTTRIYTFGAAPTVYGATLDTRISDLRNAINVAEANGKLTASQAADMRAQLDRTANAYIATRSSNSLTFPGALAVARDLDTFNTNLATALSVQPFTPIVVSQNGTDRILVSSAVIPGSTIPGTIGTTVGGVGSTIGGLINGVGNFVGGTVGSVIGAAGNIVGGTAGTVIGTTGGVLQTAGNVLTNTVTASGDVIDASGRVIGSIVPGAFDAAVPSGGSTRVIFGTTTNVLSTNIDLRMADMRRVIGDYVLAGRLTPAQAAELTIGLDRTATSLATARAGGRTLTFDEAISMARDLDATSARLGSFIGTSPFRPMVIVQEGSPRMMIITRNGVVSELPGTGNVTAVTTTGTLPADAVAVLPILDQRRLEYDRLLTMAVANRSLSSVEAARLTGDLNVIGTKIAAGISAGPTFTLDNTVSLARSLDDFGGKIATYITGSALSPLTVVGANGLPVLSTSVFNNVVGLPSVQPTVWFTTLGNRRAELETMIATGLSSGSLTEQQATELRAELTRINGLIEGARTGGTITYTTALPIAMNLDVLGNRIHTYVTTVPFTPLIVDGRIGFVGGFYSPIDELSLRRAELGAAIDRERVLGRLTVPEAQRLQFQLGNIAEREGRFREDGLFTYRESSIISVELARFSARLNSMIANRRATVSLR